MVWQEKTGNDGDRAMTGHCCSRRVVARKGWPWGQGRAPLCSPSELSSSWPSPFSSKPFLTLGLSRSHQNPRLYHGPMLLLCVYMSVSPSRLWTPKGKSSLMQLWSPSASVDDRHAIWIPYWVELSNPPPPIACALKSQAVNTCLQVRPPVQGHTFPCTRTLTSWKEGFCYFPESRAFKATARNFSWCQDLGGTWGVCLVEKDEMGPISCERLSMAKLEI